MKCRRRAAAVLTAVLCSVILAACGKSEFGLTENTPGMMVITAENAGKDGFFLSGSLEVADGERIEITPDLRKGSIRVELIAVAEEQSIEELPDLDGEPVFAADLQGIEGSVAEVPAGSYMLKATCLKRATGTVRLEVKPVSE